MECVLVLVLVECVLVLVECVPVLVESDGLPELSCSSQRSAQLALLRPLALGVVRFVVRLLVLVLVVFVLVVVSSSLPSSPS